ncbi:hypothetical protein Scep_020152 [Stephania cephalantha]|uniref:Uncharacterized protein n=1 Tax=Stephania cephalantha TaxID=152367 RepID=A0AAP0IC76_9MAGN
MNWKLGRVQFPPWGTSTSALPSPVIINIGGCDHCEQIPSFSELPCLEELEIVSMRRVKRIGKETSTSSSSPSKK